MQVNKIDNKVAYTSLNCPVKPFKIPTDKGVLYCRELDYTKEYTNTSLRKLGKFFLDIFARTSSHPFWEKCRKPTLDSFIYNDYIKDNIFEYRKALSDPDTTIILAKNKWGNIKAAIFTTSLNLEDKVKEPNTIYIDSIAVNRKFQGQHIGKKLIQKVLKASKGRFEDAFLVAYKESVPFYKKLGFKVTDATEQESRAIKAFAKARIDYPEYALFLEKKLSSSSTEKWYERADKTLS